MTKQTDAPSRVPIHQLPLAKKRLQDRLPRLTLDPEPSAQRRSTTFPPSTDGVWAPTMPMWTEWPLRITKDEAIELGIDPEKGGHIDVEDVLRRWDPVDKVDGDAAGDTGNGLEVRSSKHRLKLSPVLLGVSEVARAAALPQLDVGAVDDTSPDPDAARDGLTDILSGRKVLVSADESYVPWSTRYCGHQFGQWAGQLGDGRAISLLETEADGVGRTEIQVKGAGRTPFARQADGLAVLRSGVREYLGCEAVAALGIPSTRSLAILTSGVVVVRENGPEPSSLVARLAPSFIRIGHFEALNPGDAGRNVHQLFLGGSWQTTQGGDKSGPLGGQGNLEGLRALTTWVKDDIMGDSGSVKDWFLDVVRRNARTTALWQVYGFMHGVLNTDNISVLGLTIDYGPYAFMDVWDFNHICNHSDPTGLYSYKNQPNRVLFALDSLASTLLPILGYEAKNGRAPAAGWSEGVSPDDVRGWEQLGLEAINGWNDVWTKTLDEAEHEGWQKRFGLSSWAEGDERMVRDHLSLLKTHNGDFGASLRLLCAFSGSEADIPAFARRWVKAVCVELPSDSVTLAETDITRWLKTYAARLNDDKDADAAARTAAMRAANPRFILRQWVLEDVIKAMDDAIRAGDVPTARAVLARVLDMATNPFEPYGELPDGSVQEGLSGEDAERARLCGFGPQSMLGFQCSCSS